MRKLLTSIFILLSLFVVAQNPDIHFSGTLNISAGLNAIDGIDARKPEQAYSISGNPTLHIKGIDLPFFFILSNYQRDFRQPFNQFGLSPKILSKKGVQKSIQFHLGHRSVKWSRYTLGGHRFLGAGAEVQLGLLRAGFIQGRFLKAVDRDTSIMASGLRPTYARTGMAAKLGIGTQDNYFDIIYFKADDKISSLESSPENDLIKPSQNRVLGIKGQWIIGERITFSLDGGVSGYTRDTRAQQIELDSTSKLNRWVSKTFQPRISSQISSAAEAGIDYKGKTVGLNVKYRRIDPGYTSQGSYFLRTDISQFSLGTSFSLGQKKYIFSGRLGLEHDNVNEQKLSTTKRTIFSSNANLRPHKAFSFNAQYANFGIAQEGVQVAISDTTRLDNITKSLVLNPNFNFQAAGLNHNINLVYSNQTLDDQNRFTEQFTEITSRTFSTNYTLQLGKGMSFNAGLNQTNSTLALGETTSNGITAGIGKRFKKEGLSINLSYFYNKNAFEELDNGKTTRLSANARWRGKKGHQLKLRIFTMNNESFNTAVSRSFTERNIRLTYSYRFTTQKKK